MKKTIKKQRIYVCWLCLFICIHKGAHFSSEHLSGEHMSAHPDNPSFATGLMRRWTESTAAAAAGLEFSDACSPSVAPLITRKRRRLERGKRRWNDKQVREWIQTALNAALAQSPLISKGVISSSDQLVLSRRKKKLAGRSFEFRYLKCWQIEFLQ